MASRTALITGASGFFGGILKRTLLAQGWSCVNLDLLPDDDRHPQLESIQGDIRSAETLEAIFSTHFFDVVFHCAAILAHGTPDKQFLWTSNVDGTRCVAEAAKKYKVPKVIFTSSNCLWGESFHRPVREDDAPAPVELYGRSKGEGEKILLSYVQDFDVTIFRCPTIMAEERLGLLSILFEFIDEGRRVWVVGGGCNRYQFIYAGDLADACLRAVDHAGSTVFNIGSDSVKTLREVFTFVTDKAGTGARVTALPRTLTLLAMRIAFWLGMSPLGPYQYKMIAEDFEFDTSKIKRELGWHPTLTNGEMLWKAYNHYHQHRGEIEHRTNVSAHRQPAKMGIIRLLKWMS
ncbi:MAG: NAD(P)-dependent oxidoreductase [Candidatus Peregrinibacteria bacterium]